MQAFEQPNKPGQRESKANRTKESKANATRIPGTSNGEKEAQLLQN